MAWTSSGQEACHVGAVILEPSSDPLVREQHQAASITAVTEGWRAATCGATLLVRPEVAVRMLMDAAARAAKYAPLGVEGLTGALRELPGWTCDGTRLMRTIRPRDLWTLLEQVVAAEEELDHHTEVTLEAGTVTFTLWTHVRNAVTAADVELARRLDRISESLGV